MKNNKIGLSSNTIKLIAIIAMTIDHLTWVIFPSCQIKWYVIFLHIIGRITAPIMWFFIVEGYHHTHDVKKYVFRLFAFALISHIPYCLVFGIPLIPFTTGIFNQTSVMWSLAWAVVMLILNDNKNISQFVRLFLMICICVIALPSNWSSIPVMAVCYMNMFRGNFKKQMTSMMVWCCIYAILYSVFLDKIYGIIQIFTFLSIPILNLYNGKKGNFNWMKTLFYIYYPLHLIILSIIKLQK